MKVDDAFRWQGGGRMIVELTLDKGGRRADLREIVDALHRFRWTAAVAETVTKYGLWILEDKPNNPKFMKFDSFINSFPDPAGFPVYESEIDEFLASLSETHQSYQKYLDAHSIHEQLVWLIGSPRQFEFQSAGPMDFPLWIELIGAVHENPSRFWLMVVGSVMTTAVAGAIWSGMEWKKQSTAQECRSQYLEVYRHQQELIVKQARLMGTVTPQLVQMSEQLAKTTTVAMTGCEPEISDLVLKVHPSDATVEFRIVRHDRKAHEQAADRLDGARTNVEVELPVSSSSRPSTRSAGDH